MESADGKVLISYKAGLNEKDATGFRVGWVTLDRVADMVRSAGQYSAVEFREGYRDAAHAIPYSELMILDYDDGVTLGDAAEMFRQYIGIVATTRNHRKEKNGVACDRFRVILPTREPVMLGVEEYRKMMSEVIHNYGTDKACSNMSRMYYGYPDAEVAFLSGYQLFDWMPFYQSALDKERQQQYRRPIQQPSGDRQAAQLDKAIQTFMGKNFVTGARNARLFRLSRWLKDEGVPDIQNRLYSLNSLSGCPLPDDEVNKILKRL